MLHKGAIYPHAISGNLIMLPALKIQSFIMITFLTLFVNNNLKQDTYKIKSVKNTFNFVHIHC